MQLRQPAMVGIGRLGWFSLLNVRHGIKSILEPVNVIAGKLAGQASFSPSAIWKRKHLSAIALNLMGPDRTER